EKSNAILNNALTRILQKKVTLEQDQIIIDQARNWLLQSIQHSMQVVIGKILEPAPDQSPKERRLELGAKLLLHANDLFPEMHKEVKKINAMNEQALKELISKWKDAPDKSHFKDLLKQALQASWEDARKLVLQISSSGFIQNMLAEELDANK